MTNNEKPSVRQILTQYTGGRIRTVFNLVKNSLLDGANEVRLRADKPLLVKNKGEETAIYENGQAANSPNDENIFCPTFNDIIATVEMMSQYSLYAYEEEIRNGFLTIPGGNRVGICGRTVIENGRIKTIKNISGLNIRLTYELKGCANKVMPYIATPEVYHTLIISPPGRGKTTLLRDMVRQLSNGYKGQHYTVGIADERSEIASCFHGIAQNDVGVRTDVLDGCPKADGIMLLIRSMSPQIIAVDEIGSKEDVYAIENSLNAGITLFCTVHGKSVQDVAKKPILDKLIKRNVFERFVVLSSGAAPGTVLGIYDKTGAMIKNGG